MSIGKINTGDWLHILQIAALIFAAGMGYNDVKATAGLAREAHDGVQRVEKYLSSKDAKYWQIVKEQ